MEYGEFTEYSWMVRQWGRIARLTLLTSKRQKDLQSNGEVSRERETHGCGRSSVLEGRA